MKLCGRCKRQARLVLALLLAAALALGCLVGRAPTAAPIAILAAAVQAASTPPARHRLGTVHLPIFSALHLLERALGGKTLMLRRRTALMVQLICSALASRQLRLDGPHAQKAAAAPAGRAHCRPVPLLKGWMLCGAALVAL